MPPCLLQLAESPRKPGTLLRDPRDGSVGPGFKRAGLPAAVRARVGIRVPCRIECIPTVRRVGVDAGQLRVVPAERRKGPHPVGLKKPNDLGLFDMLGNAFEWTEDRYTRDGGAASTGSARMGMKTEGVEQEVEVVLRGGAFNSPASSLRSAYRERSSPSEPLATYGFRYVRTLRSAPRNKPRSQ